MIVNRKGSCELYGYDIMIDSSLHPWLIEINSSPAMDYSTPITEHLVKEVSEDIIKVIVDYPASKGPTGNFTLLYRAPRVVEKPLHPYPLSLEVLGVSSRKKANV